MKEQLLVRSPLVRAGRWCFSRRGFRRLLIVAAWAATLITLVYAEENFRGRRAWNQYRRGLERTGEQLNLSAFIPPPIPDEENFAATPFVRSWFERAKTGEPKKIWQDGYAELSLLVPQRKDKSSPGKRQFLDLVAWSKAFAALQAGSVDRSRKFSSDSQDLDSRAAAAPLVLEGLKTSGAYLAELRDASRRSRSRYPVVYDLENPWGILLPHLVNLRSACERLQLRACAELALNESGNALDDVKIILYVADSLKDEPCVISYLVRLACFQLAVQPIWEGLAEHRWSEADLKTLETRLLREDFITELVRPLDAERAAAILTVDLLHRRKYSLANLAANGSSDAGLDLFTKLAPRGWYYQEELNYCRLFELQIAGAFDVTQHRVWPRRAENNRRAVERELGSGSQIVLHHRFIARLLLPPLGNIIRKSAEGQTAVYQSAIACGLERCRLAKGQFPESLESLAPEWIEPLPHDVLTGGPYKYRREPSRFILYSTGWDETDDGGVAGKALFDEKQGDWVWEYPPTSGG
jgi:hypothetical protein